jgi:type I restriction enzyme S subunit
LKKMPVLLPPREQSERLNELVTLIEAKTSLNLSIATHAMELADAYHETWARQRASWPTTEFAKVVRARTGRAASASVDEGGLHTTWVAPSDVLNASLPYLEATGQQGPAEPGVICNPGTILIATRPEGGRAVVTSLPTAARRDVLSVHPVDAVDRWWLLHELRSRGAELADAAQGRHARAITQRAFGQLPVSWPDLDLRERFHRVAEPLHRVVRQMLDENGSLNGLLCTLLREISSGEVGRPPLGRGEAESR